MHEFLIGLETVFSLQGILAIVIGCVIGIIVGALPGLGPSLGVALLIPATYSLSPSVSFNLLVSLYLAAEYGGSITAILIGTPGTAAATATVLDGYKLNQRGQGELALRTSLLAATIGGVVGGVALILFSQPLVAAALRFGPPEYFALGLFGLVADRQPVRRQRDQGRHCRGAGADPGDRGGRSGVGLAALHLRTV